MRPRLHDFCTGAGFPPLGASSAVPARPWAWGGRGVYFPHLSLPPPFEQSAATIVWAVAELLPSCRSVGELTIAVLVMTVPGVVVGLTRTTRVKVASGPTVNAGVVHVTVPVVPTGGVVHVQSEGAESVWNVVSSSGSGSVSTTAVATLGPLLV